MSLKFFCKRFTNDPSKNENVVGKYHQDFVDILVLLVTVISIANAHVVDGSVIHRRMMARVVKKAASISLAALTHALTTCRLNRQCTHKINTE